MRLESLLLAWRRRARPEAVIDRAYPAWARRKDAADLAYWRARTSALRAKPKISVVMPVHNPPAAMLREAIASVEAQLYANWELCVVDDASTAPHVADILQQAAQRDHRIDPLFQDEQTGIAGATNAGIGRASGTFVAFMDHDDMLAPHALAAFAAEIEKSADLAMIFSDEDHLVHGRRASPYFKPGWNPDLLLGQNMVCHLAVFSRTLLSELGGVRYGYDGAQDYDLALRAADALGPRRIRHIPDILYHWRQTPESFSARQAEKCQAAARRALADHLFLGAGARRERGLPQWTQVEFPLPQTLPSVSLILPNGATAPETAYAPTEILYGMPADMAPAAQGDILVFLGAGLRAMSESWLHELVRQVLRPDIGCAGGLLTGPRGQWAHTGFVLHPVSIVADIAPPSDVDDPGYRGQFRLMRTVSAVSADCLAIRREVFLQAGGWNKDAGDFAAVDLCLRAAARHLRTVWTPLAALRYHRAKRAGTSGAGWMRARWGDRLAADPYLNPNLTVRRGQLRLRAVTDSRKTAR
jgi:GT2 family glycosyltransferase